MLSPGFPHTAMAAGANQGKIACHSIKIFKILNHEEQTESEHEEKRCETKARNVKDTSTRKPGRAGRIQGLISHHWNYYHITTKHYHLSRGYCTSLSLVPDSKDFDWKVQFDGIPFPRLHVGVDTAQAGRGGGHLVPQA
jgi:hypothetical protein